eukprot:TRINITY_DN463_c0_g1_i2.p1 TRINITY_DN463_c0_g1~~TRINITY_DN463_c0_g1_i2.p1  ORF type:complete len:302 (-),score=54.80 TRINITY_DN463_c0_g1_i2:304-1209(-)
MNSNGNNNSNASISPPTNPLLNNPSAFTSWMVANGLIPANSLQVDFSAPSQAQNYLQSVLSVYQNQQQQASEEGPNFSKIYAFLGSLFDPTASNHVEALNEMSATDREIVQFLMHILAMNLANRQFREQHVSLLEQYQKRKQDNPTVLLESNNCASESGKNIPMNEMNGNLSGAFNNSSVVNGLNSPPANGLSNSNQFQSQSLPQNTFHFPSSTSGASSADGSKNDKGVEMVGRFESPNNAFSAFNATSSHTTQSHSSSPSTSSPTVNTVAGNSHSLFVNQTHSFGQPSGTSQFFSTVPSL